MSWIRRYQLRLFFVNSIWILPVLGIAAGLISVWLLSRFERAMGWQMNLSAETGRTVMGLIASSMFTLVIVGSSTILVTVQLAGAQLTPRIISLVYRVTTRKIALAIFAFTLTFSVAALVRIDKNVPLLTGYLAAYGFLLNLAFFVFFIDRIGKALNPNAVLQYVAFNGRKVLREVYPQLLIDSPLSPAELKPLGEPTRTIFNIRDGFILAFDAKGLVALATRSNCLIEVVPEVGDFVAVGDPLFRIFEGGESVSEEALRDSMALGAERTLEQDPLFAFRIIVDVASKALSPAINDPTTAVLAIDQLHHLLREVGKRYLAEGEERDVNGKVRVVYKTPNWEDFVHLAVKEIRQYGGESIQIMRRMRAMLENLMVNLPARRTAVLANELTLLSNTIRRSFPDVDDQEQAEISDLQGMGSGQDANRLRGQPLPEGSNVRLSSTA